MLLLLALVAPMEVMAVSKAGAEQIKSDEGFTPKATHLRLQSGAKEKVKTIGYGYNIDAAADPLQDLMDIGLEEEEAKQVLAGKKEIDKDQGDLLFNISLQRAEDAAQRVIPGYHKLDPELQDVFVNMSYQLGPTGLKEFRRMRTNLVKGDFKGVAREILDSDFARNDATKRAERLAKKVISVGSKITKESNKNKEVNRPPPSLERRVNDQLKEKSVSRLAKAMGKQSVVSRLAEAINKNKTTTNEDSDKNGTNTP